MEQRYDAGTMRLLLVVVILVACGGKPPVPKRLVVEGDVGSWKFRRFQGPLLDIEVWVDGNKGEAYSASYITESSEKRGQIDDKDLVNVTVTRYERNEGVVRETVKLVRRLAAEKGTRLTRRRSRACVRSRSWARARCGWCGHRATTS
jgi:hypothetical protein